MTSRSSESRRTTSSEGPSHRRGRVVDDRILAATLETIATTGSLDIRVDDVAAAAGVNKTTVYRRYPERDELVLSALLANAATVAEIPDVGTLTGDLRALGRRVRDAITSPIGRALLAADAGVGPAFAELRRTFWDERFTAAAAIVERGIERGECPDDVDPRSLVERVVGPIHFRANQLGLPVDDDFIDELVDRALA